MGWIGFNEDIKHLSTNMQKLISSITIRFSFVENNNPTQGRMSYISSHISNYSIIVLLH